jgi:hypothetical protein
MAAGMKVSRVSFVAGFAGLTFAEGLFNIRAAEAQPSIALPVGQNATFRIVTQSNDNQSQDLVNFSRVSASVFNVSVNGAPPFPVNLTPGGNLTIPQSASRALSPFKQISVIMRGAPQPLEFNSSWVADMPVPNGKGQTDNVPLVVTVTNFGASGMTVRAVGQNMTSTRRRLREVMENVSLSYTITFGPAKTLTYAEGNYGVDAQRRFISKDFGGIWTVSRQ